MKGACLAAALALAAVLAVSCASPPPPAVPDGEVLVRPEAAPGELTRDEARAFEVAWRKLLAGDTRGASRGFEKLLRKHRGLPPAETALAWSQLRAGRVDLAGAGFAGVLARPPRSPSALAGAGSVAARRGDPDAALSFLREAASVRPDDAMLRRRVGELKLQATDRWLAAAQRALAAGDAAGAEKAERAALDTAPELSAVRLALAERLSAAGNAAEAIELLQGDPTGDRQVALRAGRLLTETGQYARAREVFQGLLARDPKDDEARRGERAALEAERLAGMPEEFRRIPEAARITRADLAALLAAQVTALGRLGPREPRVAVDISASWAREPIAAMLALGVLDVYPNHTFQPGAAVRRGDLARALARVLDLLGAPRSPGPLPTDMAPTHLDYEPAVRVLGAGLMAPGAGGAFEPWRAVSGREAIESVDALVGLVGS